MSHGSRCAGVGQRTLALEVLWGVVLEVLWGVVMLATHLSALLGFSLFQCHHLSALLSRTS